jgi:hypothetical protein
MASYSEPGSNKINIYLPRFNASDSDYLKYGFGRGEIPNSVVIKLFVKIINESFFK